MKYYYVNRLDLDTELPIKAEYPNYPWGLFTIGSSEYLGGRDYTIKFDDLRVIGCYVADITQKRISDVHRCDVHIDTEYCTIAWNKYIVADSDNEAFEKFTNEDWYKFMPDDRAMKE